MDKVFEKVLVSLIFFMSTCVIGQEGSKIDIAYIHNDWVLSADESLKNVHIFRPKGFFEYAETDESWLFENDNDIFYNTTISKGRMGFIHNKGRPSSPICNRGGRYGFIPSRRLEGKWKLVEKGDQFILELSYYEIEKGKQVELSRTIRYLVVHLEEHLMELTTINAENVW